MDDCIYLWNSLSRITSGLLIQDGGHNCQCCVPLFPWGGAGKGGKEEAGVTFPIWGRGCVGRPSVHAAKARCLCPQPWSSVLPAATLALGHSHPAIPELAPWTELLAARRPGPCWCSNPHLPILRPSTPQALAVFGVMLAPGWAGEAPAAVQPRGWETLTAWRRAALQSCCLLACWPWD